MSKKVLPGILWLNLLVLSAAWIGTLENPNHYYMMNTAILFWVFSFATCVCYFCVVHRLPDSLRSCYHTSLFTLGVCVIFLLSRFHFLA